MLRDNPSDGLGGAPTLRLAGEVEGIKAHFVWDYQDEVFVTVFPCEDPAPQLQPHSWPPPEQKSTGPRT